MVGKYGIEKSKYCWNRYKEEGWRSDWDCATIFCSIITGSIIIIGIIIIICQIFDIITCVTFPEKVIIEELKSIYKTMNM